MADRSNNSDASNSDDYVDVGEPSGGSLQGESTGESGGSDDHEKSVEMLVETAPKPKFEYGCEHYFRRCKIRAPCCNEVFGCRHCHNEAKNTNEKDPKKRHEIDRKAVTSVICRLCDHEQPVAAECRLCGVRLGNYYCAVCKFWDDDTAKGQFHCDQCGICRVGGAENFFHCDTCACCYALEMKLNGHQCVERSMHQNCPVCFEFLFDSRQKTNVMKCGHTIHESCKEELHRSGIYQCPICSKSIIDMSVYWRKLDEEIAATLMPEEYRNTMVDVLCNDCSTKSRVRFHVVGHKCSNATCGSYNTVRIKPASPPPEERNPSHAADAAGQ